MPRPSLSSCVFAMFSRDTIGIDFSESERVTYFPSVPACSLVWVLEGQLQAQVAVDGDGFRLEAADDLSAFSFLGPRSRPVMTSSPAALRVFSLLLLPDAFHALTGTDPGAYINRVVPAADVLGDEWAAMADAVRCAADDDTRVRLVQDHLAPLWADRRPPGRFHGRLIQDWSNALALRAATSGFGRSLRQVERRIKQWTGQPLRDLKRMVRLETVMLDAVLAIQQGDVNWAELAAASGFSDQAHLCRQIRLLTGFSPQELMRRTTADEAMWFYRLWGGVPHLAMQRIEEPLALEPGVAGEIDSRLVSLSS